MFRWSGVFGCALALAAVSVQAQQPVVAFIDVSVIPMDTDRVLSGQTVLVRDARIAAIGPAGTVDVPSNAVKVDGQGKYLMPGLADMHSHLIYEIKRGGEDEEHIQYRLLQVLATGITTVRDMHSGGYRNDDSLAMKIKQGVAAGRLIGPHLYTAGDPIAFEDSDAVIREGMVSLKAKGHEFVKIYELPMEKYRVIKAMADSLGLRVSGHVLSNIGGVEGVLKARWSSVEHLMGYVNYLVGATDFDGEVAGTEDEGADWLQDNYKLDEAKLRQIAAATRQAGVWNCPTLAAVQNVVAGASIARAGERFFEYNLRVVKALHEAGAGLLLGMDTYDRDVPTDEHLQEHLQKDLQGELKLLTRAGLTPYQALETGTRNVARFLDVEAKAGTVAIGKQADLILLDKNPLTDVSHTEALAGVMIGGRWLPMAELAQRLSNWERAHKAKQDSDSLPGQDSGDTPEP